MTDAPRGRRSISGERARAVAGEIAALKSRGKSGLKAFHLHNSVLLLFLGAHLQSRDPAPASLTFLHRGPKICRCEPCWTNTRDAPRLSASLPPEHGDKINPFCVHSHLCQLLSLFTCHLWFTPSAGRRWFMHYFKSFVLPLVFKACNAFWNNFLPSVPALLAFTTL